MILRRAFINLYYNYNTITIFVFPQVNSSYLRGPYTEYVGREGLMVTTLGLKFEAGMQHFRSPISGHLQHQRNRHDRDMKLKCVATLGTVYWKSKEQSALAHRPRLVAGLPIPAVDDGLAADEQDADSRADPVHGKQKKNPHVVHVFWTPLSSLLRLIHS